MRPVPVVFLATLFLGCAHSPETRAGAPPPTCAVLSVGGLQGVAHVGALMALRDAGVRIDCISGTSMGSLVAGLYATAPSENLVDRFRSFKGAYRSRTEDDVGVGGLLGALAVGVLTGGAALPAMAGGLLGMGSVEKVDRDRVVLTLDEDVFKHAEIENLPIPYATFFQQKSGEGLKVVDARSGNLAQNIGRSIANPFIFPNLDVVSEEQMDPGGDRMAAVPVEDTCRVFPGHRLIALNVTGQHAVHTKEMRCPVEEIMIDVGVVDGAALFSDDDRELERVVAIGWRSAAQHFGGLVGVVPPFCQDRSNQEEPSR